MCWHPHPHPHPSRPGPPKVAGIPLPLFRGIVCQGVRYTRLRPQDHRPTRNSQPRGVDYYDRQGPSTSGPASAYSSRMRDAGYQVAGDVRPKPNSNEVRSCRNTMHTCGPGEHSRFIKQSIGRNGEVGAYVTDGRRPSMGGDESSISSTDVSLSERVDHCTPLAGGTLVTKFCRAWADLSPMSVKCRTNRSQHIVCLLVSSLLSY